MFFVGRHVSVRQALVALGLSAEQADAMCRAAKASGALEVRLTRGGFVYLVHRMRGNHAEVWREHGAGC